MHSFRALREQIPRHGVKPSAGGFLTVAALTSYNKFCMCGLSAETVLWDEARLANPHHQPDKAARVRAMFDAIAPTYERVNHVLSAGRDAAWRRRAVTLVCVRPGERVLDLACGTGDFARAFGKAGPSLVVGLDFSEKMLALAVGRDDQSIRWCRADALAIPFADESFEIVSCAFGVRNFQALGAGLREAARVLAPGGRVVILEFSLPRSRLWNALYHFYFQRVLPRLAAWISRDQSGAYRYLPRSVSSFPDEHCMKGELRSAGFDRVAATTLTLGVATIYVAWKKR